jgi:hypothetical protein
VRILCTNQNLGSRGGTETYLETIAPELRELGHDVELFCLAGGLVADRLRAHGFAVHERVTDLRTDYDVVHAQQASTACLVRARLPDVPIVFASHSWFFPSEDPPREVAPSAVVVFNDVVAERIHASAISDEVPVHRLTQPVTVGMAEDARMVIRRRPRRAVVMSRKLSVRLDHLADACRRSGIDLEVLGRAQRVEDPTPAYARADVVFGAGRTIVEALAQARAAFVYDEAGGAGFVTASSYRGLEACGFTALVGEPITDVAASLRGYQRDLGPLGRELAVRHHAASRHAAALVEIYRQAAPPPTPLASPDLLRRLADLHRRVYGSELRARTAEWDTAREARRNQELRYRLDDLQRELDAVWQSTSWRLTAPLRRLRRRPPMDREIDEPG